MGNLHDPTIPLPASAAWSTETLWIKNDPTGNSTVDIRHSMGPQEFARRIPAKLPETETIGFKQLRICGLTGYLVKAR
ncbi:hypothetical protein N7495_008057 [Penicillium taxi]|uniref:uncharacterized protein n=1 Tax=Penicillium taxi TaxID=168475 RepID=UPI0025451A8E|nr:uncharacterized protein N7495_008057 [Penicillium taxi]KAJ5888016.1 hypothetical protein N7495_008057 [Penicillium taxi]